MGYVTASRRSLTRPLADPLEGAFLYSNFGRFRFRLFRKDHKNAFVQQSVQIVVDYGVDVKVAVLYFFSVARGYGIARILLYASQVSAGTRLSIEVLKYCVCCIFCSCLIIDFLYSCFRGGKGGP